MSGHWTHTNLLQLRKFKCLHKNLITHHAPCTMLQYKSPTSHFPPSTTSFSHQFTPSCCCHSHPVKTLKKKLVTPSLPLFLPVSVSCFSPSLLIIFSFSPLPLPSCQNSENGTGHAQTGDSHQWKHNPLWIVFIQWQKKQRIRSSDSIRKHLLLTSSKCAFFHLLHVCVFTPSPNTRVSPPPNAELLTDFILLR